MDNQLDPTVVNLAKAIRQSETGGDFNAVGDKNASHKSYGAYQFGEDTWNATAPKYGVNVPIQKATPEQQNAVAYNQIKAWKDQGKDVTQIASMWNAGQGEPNAYTGKFSNGKPSVVKGKFDVPSYAKSVATAYQTLKQGGQVNADPNNPSSTAAPQTTQQNQSPSVGGFLGNVVSSGANFVGGIANAVMHPIKTIEGLGKIALGGVEKLIPGEQGQEKNFDQVVDFYKKRYGGNSIEEVAKNILHSAYTDPVGVAADASVLLSGGSAIAGKLGAVSDLEKAAQVAKAGGSLADMSAVEGTSAASKIASGLKTGAEVTNPINMVGKTLGLVKSGVLAGLTRSLGNTSGIGTEGANAALSSNADYVNATKGLVGYSAQDLVNTAKQGVSDLTKKNLVDYKNGLIKIGKNFNDLSPEEQLAFKTTATQAMKDSLSKTLEQFKVGVDKNSLDFSNSGVSREFQTNTKNMYKDIIGHTDMTPEGINNLENKVYSYVNKLRSSPVNVMATKISNDLKSFLRESIPEFKTMDAAYKETKDILKGMKQDLNVGGTAGAETIFNKIAKVAKNNNDLRAGTLQALNKLTGKDLQMWALGLKGQSWMPAGIMGRLGEIGSFVHPQLLTALLITSPRSVITFLRALGWSERMASNFAQKINLAKSALYAGESQQIQQGQSIPLPQ